MAGRYRTSSHTSLIPTGQRGHSYVLNNTFRVKTENYVVTVRSRQEAAAVQNQHTPRKALGNISCALALNTFKINPSITFVPIFTRTRLHFKHPEDQHNSESSTNWRGNFHWPRCIFPIARLKLVNVLTQIGFWHLHNSLRHVFLCLNVEGLSSQG